MADRIERYLGRLEAELENKLDSAQMEAILLEVECHLRESEEAYVELGEPSELANRLAVNGFGRHDFLQKFPIRHKSGEPTGWRRWILAGVIATIWIMSMFRLFKTGGYIFPGLADSLSIAIVLSCVIGWFTFRWVRLHTKVLGILMLYTLSFWMICGGLIPGETVSSAPKLVPVGSSAWNEYIQFQPRFAALDAKYESLFAGHPDLKSKLAEVEIDSRAKGMQLVDWRSDGLYFDSERSKEIEKWLHKVTGLSAYEGACAVKWEQMRRQAVVFSQFVGQRPDFKFFAILQEVGPRFLGFALIYFLFGGLGFWLRQFVDRIGVIWARRKANG